MGVQRTAYGLAVVGDVDVQGATRPPVDVAVGCVAVVSDEPGQDAGERVFTQRDARGEEAVTLDRLRAGYRMRVGGLGDFEIGHDGARIACGGGERSWPWQRVLAGHALPMAALLQGVEVLHAAGVAVQTPSGPRAVAIAAGSHGGKSSLSVNLALRGHALLSDDAIGVQADAGRVLVHPGVGAATLRAGEVEALRARGLLDRLEIVGELHGVVRVLVERHSLPVALGTMYWPEREPGATAVGFERLPAEPRRVLAGTINLVLQDPERMARHFDVASAIATGVPLFRVAVPPDVGAGELAVAIERHATELLAA